MCNKKESTPKGAIQNQSHYNDILNLLQPGTQNYNVWQFMHTHGSINPLAAYHQLGILALHSRINDLRQLGAEIHKEMVYRNGSRYGVYSIENEPIYCQVAGDDIECKFRDGCHYMKEGCAWMEFLDEHPEYLTDDDDESIRRMNTWNI